MKVRWVMKDELQPPAEWPHEAGGEVFQVEVMVGGVRYRLAELGGCLEVTTFEDGLLVYPKATNMIVIAPTED